MKKYLPAGNNRIVIGGSAIPRKHDQMVALTNPFDFKVRSGESISARVLPVAVRWNARAIDEYRVVTHNDVIAGKPDQAFDVMN